MSNKPVIAPLSRWISSNMQLTSYKNRSHWQIDQNGPTLAGLCVIITKT
jgi:hypothetical protein